jgi:hypothetical protein
MWKSGAPQKITYGIIRTFKRGISPARNGFAKATITAMGKIAKDGMALTRFGPHTLLALPMD